MTSRVWQRCYRQCAYVRISRFELILFCFALALTVVSIASIFRSADNSPAFRTPPRARPPIRAIRPPRLPDPRSRLAPFKSRISPRQARPPRTIPHSAQRTARRQDRRRTRIYGRQGQWQCGGEEQRGRHERGREQGGVEAEAVEGEEGKVELRG